MQRLAQNIERELVAGVRKASREMVRELGFLTGHPNRFKLTAPQSHTLIEIAQRGRVNIQELAAVLKIDKSNASRTVKDLWRRKMVTLLPQGNDRRTKYFMLTELGKNILAGVHEDSNRQVADALGVLTAEERKIAFQGLYLYSKALQRSRSLKAITIREVAKEDNPHLARLIRTVMPEFGAVGPGYAINDPEVDCMYETYQSARSVYLVAERENMIVGGAGIAPLRGGNKATCELQKMYLFQDGRGLGLGSFLLEKLLETARRHRFKQCYLETLPSMKQAQKLYEKFGFKKLSGPMGSTGHTSCTVWYLKDLTGIDR